MTRLPCALKGKGLRSRNDFISRPHSPRSYDDFYLDVTATLRGRPLPTEAAAAWRQVKILGEGGAALHDDVDRGRGAEDGGSNGVGEVSEVLRSAACLALEVQASVRDSMNMSVSIGVAGAPCLAGLPWSGE